MKYSRKEIDKAGKTVITEKDTTKVNEALNTGHGSGSGGQVP